jgi:predicted enzyme related to lactoylglutathione lyase
MRYWTTAVIAGLALAIPAQAQERKMTAAPIVFFDIAGPDSAALSKFYSSVFNWDVTPTGQMSVPLTGGALPGSMRADPAEKILYIGVGDVTATLAAIERAGGKTVAPRFEVKGVAVIGLFTDPAGNRMGLVEMADGKPKVP